MLRVMVLVALMTGCAGTFGASAERRTSALTHVNRIGLGVAVATTACDWGQTRAAATDGWVGFHEANPIMGDRPSTTTVDIYMTSATALIVGASLLLPERWRPVLHGAVVAREIFAVARSSTARAHRPGICGLGRGEVAGS